MTIRFPARTWKCGGASRFFQKPRIDSTLSVTQSHRKFYTESSTVYDRLVEEQKRIFRSINIHSK